MCSELQSLQRDVFGPCFGSSQIEGLDLGSSLLIHATATPLSFALGIRSCDGFLQLSACSRPVGVLLELPRTAQSAPPEPNRCCLRNDLVAEATMAVAGDVPIGLSL